MKFAHIADCHIGGWRDHRMRSLNIKSFCIAIDRCKQENIDFLIIAGDLFNTPFPGIELLKTVVQKLRELKDQGITVYGIAGSHDFSASGKTMIGVLEEAQLFTNVSKGTIKDNLLTLDFTIDQKTGAKLTGIPGKKGMLDKNFYNSLNRIHLEQESGTKIFVFHTLLSELKPKEYSDMDSQPLSLLPKNFSYYAAGHPHMVTHSDLENYPNIVYPGPIFPNNLAELEKLKNGGFYIYDNGNITFNPIIIKEGIHIKIDCNGKNADEIPDLTLELLKDKQVKGKIITLRFFGALKHGKPSDIDFKSIISELYLKSAYFVMKNTAKLAAIEFEEVKIRADSVELIESEIIKEHSEQLKNDWYKENHDQLISILMQTLHTAKEEGETNTDFENRINSELDSIILPK